MLEKLRLKGKRRASLIATNTQSSTSPKERQQSSDSKQVGFLDLPPELRNQIYELAADAASLLLFPNSRKPIPPALLFANRQICREYRPVVLSRAPLRVNIFDFNFRPLLRVIGSLYPSELKALRANTSLLITLHISRASAKESNISNLRRWTVKLSEHVDRLAWSYEAIPSHTNLVSQTQVREMMRECRENMYAVALLSKKVHENLDAELEPVVQAIWERLHYLQLRDEEYELAKVRLPST